MADALKPHGHAAAGGSLPGWRKNAAFWLGGAVLLLLLGGLWGVAAQPCWGQEKPNAKLLFLGACPRIKNCS